MSDPAGRVRLAVDAGNLVRDRRGLGRLTRGILAVAAADPGFTITLLADRRDDARSLVAEFPYAAPAATRTAKRRDTYDVVWYPFNGMRFASAAPSVVTIADAFAFTQPHPERIARARERRPIERAARDATRIVTISKWSRAEIERELAVPADKIDVVTLEPDEFFFPERGDALPEALASARFALVVGVREPRKNARLALDAFARAQRDPNELLVIVGDLSAADTAHAKALEVRAGTIAASDRLLRALYRNATVVLVPSLAEGFGLVAVEALACAAPVIASNAAALPEATAGAALLLDPRDVDAWAHAIRELFDDTGKAAAMRARAESAFAPATRRAPARAMLEILRATSAR